MRDFTRLLASAALACALGVGPAAMAQPPHPGPGAPPVQAGRGGQPAPGAARMPPRGFRNAPPNFTGRLPAYRGGPRGNLPQAGRFQPGRPGRDLGTFRGRTFSSFTPLLRSQWQSGVWRHTVRDGHLGWWWVVGGSWFFYPAPIYPYPGYIGPAGWYDYYAYYPTPSYYWYYCEDPPGYYPYVQYCNGPWEPVPPQY